MKHDKKEFLNDSEWELLSVSSSHNILQSYAGEAAQIQFHVSPPPCPGCPFLGSPGPSVLG